jgi:predicted PurR-regulated permease PerM
VAAITGAERVEEKKNSAEPLPEFGVSWKSLTLFLITACILAISVEMIHPFLAALTGAIVLGVITQRPYRWIERKMGSSTLAAGGSVLIVALGIISPVLFLVWNIGRHLLLIARMVQDGTAERALDRLVNQSPLLLKVQQYFIDHFELSQAIEKGAGFVASKMTSALNSSISGVTQAIIMLFVLFFVYRDGTLALASFRSLLPMTETETDLLLTRIDDTIRTTILGRFLTASVQGFVAWIAFAGLGIRGALLLGAATALFAIIPSFGAFIVWLPVAIFLAAMHHWIKAVILTAIGSLIISTLDNFLYPVLVGTRLHMHTIPIFISILGGIWLFGLPGVVLGPIVFAIAESLLQIWRRRTESESTVETSVLS